MVWLFPLACVQAQVKWDGGANTQQWRDALNWSTDQLPTATDQVVLDNSLMPDSYQVFLPPGTETVQILGISIQPAAGKNISLILPPASTAAPALTLESIQDALDLHAGAVFTNASGAASGTPISLSGKIRIRNGGKYIHKTVRPNAGLIDRLSTATGTETGVWEFDVPGTTGYTVSLTGNIFGSLHFSAAGAGGSKSYSGSGTSPLIIRGDLQVGTGAQLTSTLTADIQIARNLVLDGKLQLHPVTGGTTGRSLIFNDNSSFSGSGNLSMNAFFRNISISSGCSLKLLQPLSLPLTPHTLLCQGQLLLGDHYIDGNGSFLLESGAVLSTGHPEGISPSGTQGCIKTSFRSFSSFAGFVFIGNGTQSTGTGLPDSVAWLEINNHTGLDLAKNITVQDSLVLTQGVIRCAPSATLSLARAAKVRSSPNAWGISNTGRENSFVDGPVVAEIAGSQWTTLPLGNGANFMPLSIRSSEASPLQVKLRYTESPPPPALNPLGPLVGGHWKLSATRGSYQVSLPYLLADCPPAPTVLGLAVLTNELNSWMELAASGYIAAANGWLVSDTAVPANTSHMDTSLYLARAQIVNTLLPVVLMHFDARRDGPVIKIAWTAQEEGKSTTYNIERSSAGFQFKTIGYIISETSLIQRHSFKDETPEEGRNYYRLRMTSADKIYYSKVVHVDYESEHPALYPNPARDFIHLRIPWISRNFLPQSSRTELVIVNYSGTVVRRMFVNTGTCQVRVSDLPSGLYLVRLLRPERSFTLFFTKY